MTLRQTEFRLKTICEAHKQVRSYFYGLPGDFFAEHTKQYAAICLQDNPGLLDVAGKQDVYGFRMWVLDLVHVANETKQNELDVMSDMREVAKDLLSEIDYNGYMDWKLSSSNPVECVYENGDDMVAGVYVDISITAVWEKNVCAVPTEDFDLNINNEDMKLVYEAYRKCTGSEGSSVNLSTGFTNYEGSQVDIAGKRIVLMIRSNVPHKKITSGSPVIQPVPEFKQTATVMEVSSDAPFSENEALFILYRTN